MASFRTFTVYLTLAALLFGNVAGWVHVGCSSHTSECCAVACDPAGRLLGEPHRHTGAAPAHDHSGHSCCHQDHANHGESEVTCQSEADKASAESDSNQPTEPHDSDRCSICQSFFASRHAALLWDTTVHLEPLTASREVVWADEAFIPNAVCNHDRVRGPPSV